MPERAVSAMTPDELTAARKALGLSQRDLADRLGVHFHTVNRWEVGHSRIPAYLNLQALQAAHTSASTRKD